MNRMFRFNIRKSHHRADAVLGMRSSFSRHNDDDDDERNNNNSEMGLPSSSRSGCRGNVSNDGGSKRSQLMTSKAKKKSSVRSMKSEPSLHKITLQVVTDHCDVSETELTVPNVDSSLSLENASCSDTEQQQQQQQDATTTTTSTSTSTVTDCLSSSTVMYDSSDQDDDEENENIPFLGNVYECDETNSEGPTDAYHKDDDVIVQVALQSSQRVLDAHATQVDNAVPSSLVVGGIGSYDTTNIEPRYVELDQMGNSLVERGESDQAIVKYVQALYHKREALSVYQNCFSPCTVLEQNKRTHVLASIATSINNLAFLQHNQSRIDANETLELYLVALQIKRHVLGCNHLSVGKTLNNIGSIHYIQRDFSKAAETYEQARQILQLHLGCHHLDVCTVTANIGDVHVSMKQWALAVKEYRMALELRWPLYGPSDPKVIRLMEQIAELEMLINQLNAQREDAQATTAANRDSNDRFYGPIVKDVRKLQKEVQRDIDHLDIILSSQAPLEMMRDKITVYREIRDMMNDDTDDEPNQTTDDEPHQTTADEPHQMTDKVATTGDVRCENTNHSSLSKACVVENIEKVTTDSIDVVIVSEDPPRTPTRTTTMTRQMRHLEIATPPTTPTVVVGTCKQSKSPQLTNEERQDALVSVKEKLAKLRANRESSIVSSLNSNGKKTTHDEALGGVWGVKISQ